MLPKTLLASSRISFRFPQTQGQVSVYGSPYHTASENPDVAYSYRTQCRCPTACTTRTASIQCRFRVQVSGDHCRAGKLRLRMDYFHLIAAVSVKEIKEQVGTDLPYRYLIGYLIE